MAKSKVGISDCKNGQEGWIMTTWTDQQWVYVFRHNDKRVRAYIAAQATYAANNNKIGYGVTDRTSFWDQLQVAGLRAGNITTPCNADHASSVAALVRGAGTLLNDGKILAYVLPTMTARTAKDMLVKAGFSYTNDQGYVLSDGYLRAGDILWKPSHMCIVTGDGKDYLEAQGTNGLSQFVDAVKSHLGEGNGWTRAMLGKDVLLPNQAWDAAYISACAKQSGVLGTAFVQSTNSGSLIDNSIKQGYGEFVKGPADGDKEATPKIGDVVAFTYKQGVRYSHVGVVVNVHNNDVTVVSGDVSDVVDSSIVKKSFKSIRGYYRPKWGEYGLYGGDYDPGDWIGESSADLYYDRSLALIREVGFMDDSGAKSVSGGKYRLGVVNYTQLLELLEEGEGIGGELGGMLEDALSPEQIAAYMAALPANTTAIMSDLVKCALAQVGKSYKYGSKGVDSFDCSGLVSYVYAQSGIKVGTSTQGILDVGRANKTIVMNKRSYDVNNLAVGDLIVTSSPSSPSSRHVTIYIGGGKVVSATGQKYGVETRAVTTNASSILGVVRPLLKAGIGG